LYFEKAFTINVTDVNEAPTSISLSNNTVPENKPVDTVVGTLSTSDPDADDIHTYKLVDGQGSTDNASFNISGNNLRTSAVFNYEVKNSYSIRIRSTDKSGLYFEKAFTILVTGVNNAPVAVDDAYQTDMNQPLVVEAPGILANDSDPDGDDLSAIINIGPSNGTLNLSSNGAFSYTPNSGFSGIDQFAYTANDGEFNSNIATVIITVVATNQAPTNIALSNNTVPENDPVNTVVGTLSTSDPDAGDTHTYTLVSGEGSTDNASFNISGNSLRTSAEFNYEDKNSYSIRIRSTDKGGLYFEKAFTINVTDVNEAPTNIFLSNNNVPEGKPVNTIVGTFSTIDPDIGGTHTFALVSGSGSVDNVFFNIQGNALRTSAVFNKSVKDSYSIHVRTTDSGNLFYEKAFTINITDANGGKVIYLPLILKGGTSQVFGIINGGFEQGSVGWTEDSEYGWDLIYFYDDTTVDAHNGNWLAWLGGDNNEISRLSQTVKISPASPYLHFWYWIDSVDICGYDYARVKIDGNIVRTFKLCEDKNTYGWAHAAVNLSAYKGMTVSLMFEVTTDILYNSNFFLDDVSLSSSASATTNNLDKGELFVDPALDKEEFQKIY
jgi:mRNA-degrading endonuclease HigB of HigAB toxin-antitoxin module